MFALGALMCILVHDLWLLIIARVIQGVGSGCLLPLAQQVLLEVFPPEKNRLQWAYLVLPQCLRHLQGLQLAAI